MQVEWYNGATSNQCIIRIIASPSFVSWIHWSTTSWQSDPAALWLILGQLYLPSLCCQLRGGALLGQHGLLVDSFGDNLMSVTNIHGDRFMLRHDETKTLLNRVCLVRAECEVFGAFRDLIPVDALKQGEGELQRGRSRQGLLPDFRIEMQSPVVGPTLKLAELKCIGAGRGWKVMASC